MKSITKFLSHNRQDVTLTETFRDNNGRKIRLSIKSDSYEFQCHAYAEVWSPTNLRWNRVASIPHANMKTRSGLAYLPANNKATAVHFEADRQTLLTMVKAILD
jgi:hypothetical protein